MSHATALSRACRGPAARLDLRALGTLEELGTGRRVALSSRFLVGRHPSCDARPTDARVSSEHAVVRWTEGRWELRDLGSRNGTFVDGKRLPPGQRVPLGVGTSFLLGGSAVGYTLIDGAPPVPSARHVRSGQMREANHRVLSLPDDDEPAVTIFEDPSGRWLLDGEERTEVVDDRSVVSVRGEDWLLDLPSVGEITLEVASAVSLDGALVRFVVTRDEEHVEVSLAHEGGVIELPPRSFHYLLLTLARQRLAEAELPEEERGWVDRDTLCRMLAVDPLKLNVDVCRARKQLAATGVLGAAEIVARRATTGQLRLGAARILVERR